MTSTFPFYYSQLPKRKTKLLFFTWFLGTHLNGIAVVILTAVFRSVREDLLDGHRDASLEVCHDVLGCDARKVLRNFPENFFVQERVLAGHQHSEHQDNDALNFSGDVERLVKFWRRDKERSVHEVVVDQLGHVLLQQCFVAEDDTVVRRAFK